MKVHFARAILRTTYRFNVTKIIYFQLIYFKSIFVDTVAILNNLGNCYPPDFLMSYQNYSACLCFVHQIIRKKMIN